MKPINVEKLKPGDTILAFDVELLVWVKSKITQIEKYLITLEDLDGTFRGAPRYETIDRLKNPNYYKKVG